MRTRTDADGVGLSSQPLVLGIWALIIHPGHYFHRRITRWMFGADGYFHKDDRK